MKTKKEILTKEKNLQEIIVDLSQFIEVEDIQLQNKLKKELKRQFFLEGIVAGLSWVLRGENEYINLEDFWK